MAVGTTQGIVELLNEEHVNMLRLLNTLETGSERLAPGRVPDFSLLLDIVAYLKHFPDRFHHPREDLLFTALLKRDPGFAVQQRRLEKEHRELATLNDQIYQELMEIRAGRPAHVTHLRTQLRAYTNTYREHIRYESRYVFPKAERKLNARELKSLQQKTHYADDPLFGYSPNERYDRLRLRTRDNLIEVGEGIHSIEAGILYRVIGSMARSLDKAQECGGIISSTTRSAMQLQLTYLSQLSSSPGEIASTTLATGRQHIRLVQRGLNRLRRVMVQSSDSGAQKEDSL